jgi:hypothetical protein
VQAGRGFRIVELNGATSEATHIYDPKHNAIAGPLLAWRTLFEQWSLMFAIGAANRAAGHRPLGPRKLVRELLAARRDARRHPVAS